MTTFLASLLFFLLLHLIVDPRARRPFHRSLRLSRGIAAVFLTLAGLYALARWLPLWRWAFLSPNDDPVAFHVIALLCGHLVSDLLWLAVGALSRGSEPRTDLVAHHLVGLAACAIAGILGVGYTAIAIALTTEIMPANTGLTSWARLTRNVRLERLSLRLGVWVLAFWRLPLWCLILGVSIWNLSDPAVPEPLRPVYPYAVVIATILIAFDVVWSAQSVTALRNFTAAAAVPGRSAEPAAG